MLLKWFGEQGDGGAAIVERAVAVSAPMDLRGGGAGTGLWCIGELFTRAIFSPC